MLSFRTHILAPGPSETIKIWAFYRFCDIEQILLNFRTRLERDRDQSEQNIIGNR